MRKLAPITAVAATALLGANLAFVGCGTSPLSHTPTPSYAPPGYAALPANATRRREVTRENYHGWSNALAMRNDLAEVIVVPEIGRVMSFGFHGENVLWEDPVLYGKPVNPEAPEWINFGGDKSWPAPEAEWSRYTGRKEWRPPPAFDSAPNDARIDGKDVVLLSPVDPFYGVQVTRRIHLDAREPKLTIITTYERTSGAPSRISIWVITQFKDPAAVFIPQPGKSMFENGFYKFSPETWTNMTAGNGLIRVTRDTAKPHKLGSDAGQLLWVGPKTMCLVSSPRISGAEYPDRGASAEVYTNPDPKTYVELEMLGPLSLLKVGDKISRQSNYTLFPRANADAERDARRVLKR